MNLGVESAGVLDSQLAIFEPVKIVQVVLNIFAAE